MITNKGFAFNLVTLIMIGAILIGGVVLYSAFANANVMDSNTPTTPGCKVKNLPVRITGEFSVKDGDPIGVTPEPDALIVSSVYSGSMPLGVFSQEFDWEVSILNTRTNNVLDSDRGNGKLDNALPIFGTPDTFNTAYTLDFYVPDNNCDSKVDDFDGQIEGKVKVNGDIKSLQKNVQFRNGRFSS